MRALKKSVPLYLPVLQYHGAFQPDVSSHSSAWDRPGLIEAGR